MSNQTIFTAEDWYNAPSGREGRVAVCRFDPPEPRDEAGARLIGKRVTIDGADFIVHGVEGFAVTRPQKSLGLLVTSAPATDTE